MVVTCEAFPISVHLPKDARFSGSFRIVRAENSANKHGTTFRNSPFRVRQYCVRRPLKEALKFNYPSPKRLCLLKPTFERLQLEARPFSPAAEVRNASLSFELPFALNASTSDRRRSRKSESKLSGGLTSICSAPLTLGVYKLKTRYKLTSKSQCESAKVIFLRAIALSQ